MNRVFIDLDGVVVDFERYMREQALTADEVKRCAGAYLAMPAIDGAITGIRSLIGGTRILAQVTPATPAVPSARAPTRSSASANCMLTWTRRARCASHATAT